MLETLQTLSPLWIMVLCSLFGLLFGSFLNVVIYRIPKMLDLEQEEAVADYLGEKIKKKESLDFLPIQAQCPYCRKKSDLNQSLNCIPEEALPQKAPFNLLTPASTCPKCQHKIRWYENIPVISWLFLRGRCSSCKTRISPRYPLIELISALLFGAVAWQFGATVQTIIWCFFVFMALAITMIDWDTTWLPDSLSLPLLWGGLVAAALGWTIPLDQAIWGVVAGYMSLWIVAQLFYLATRRQGMANGDFKFLAALGAWFGWSFLLPILLFSSIIGILGYIIIKLLQSQRGLFEGKYIPFGPYLAAAGLAILFITPERVQALFPLPF